MGNSHKLDGLVKWAQRPEWREAFMMSFALHLAKACEEADVEVDDVPEMIGEDAFAMLWGCSFEDLIARTTEDGRNIADDYLKRRSWKESAASRAYITAVRGSTMSVYEMTDFAADGSFLARDLVRGGEALRVVETSVNGDLSQWDRLGGRLVNIQGRIILTGGVLPFDHDEADEVIAAIRAALDKPREEPKGLALKLSLPVDETTPAMSREEILASIPCMLSYVWLRNRLADELDPP